MFETIIQSPSKTFLAFCFCFVGGVAVESLYNNIVPTVILGTLFILLAASLALTWHRSNIRFFLLCGLCIMIGVARYSLALPRATPESLLAHYGETHEFVGVVADEPDVREDGVRYIIESRKWKIENSSDTMTGRVYVKMNLYPRFAYGEVLKVECTFVRPEPVEDFRYDMYLARFGVYTLCNHPRLTSTGTLSGNPVRRSLLSFKNSIASRVNELWPEPYAGFMAGLLYGYRGGLGSLNTDFARTGVTHIVAVSGYNISLIATILMIICIRALWIPRKSAFWLIVLGIFLFVIFTGASASVVRAGVMATIVLLGGYLGRPRRMANVLTATATVMLLVNPYILFWDVGFQLSFLSTLGIIYVTPIMTPVFAKFPERFGLKESLISTLSAIAGTLPLMMFQFGQLSLVSPIVNVLVLWIVPYLMIAGFTAVMASFLWYALGQTVGWVAFGGMMYVITIVKAFSSLSFAALNFMLPWWGMIIMYIVIGWFVWKQKSKKSWKSV